jgi:hypothetical protein
MKAAPMSTITIAFTSCTRYKPGQAQTVWRDILQADPDYLFLLGDQIYMDFGLWPFSRSYNGKPRKDSLAQFEATMRSRYEQQWADPHFARLLAHMRAKRGLFGVWDDHDFAWNNAYGADASCPPNAKLAEKVAVSRRLFHQFMDCAPQAPLVYGSQDTALARFIFLDNRSYATPLSAPKPVLMGDAQMDFLEQQLAHDLPYTLICGGLTLLNSAENWSRYADEFARFQRLVQQRPGVLYLGGDVHRNLFTPPQAHGLPPCYELVSSGACVNYLGLPFEFDRRRNWSLLQLEPQAVQLSQFDKHSVTRWHIDRASWHHQALGREVRPS